MWPISWMCALASGFSNYELAVVAICGFFGIASAACRKFVIRNSSCVITLSHFTSFYQVGHQYLLKVFPDVGFYKIDLKLQAS